jgi:hypothetical protein
MNIGIDSNIGAYYMKCGIGSLHHCNHPKPSKDTAFSFFPSNLVDSKLKNEMSKMARTHISFGSIRSYYNDHNSVNSRLSHQQVVNLFGGHDRVDDAVRGFTRRQKREAKKAKKAKKDSASKEEEGPTLSSPDELFLFLRANNYPYCSLTDVQESSGTHSATRLVTETDATPVSVVDAHCESPQLDEI